MFSHVKVVTVIILLVTDDYVYIGAKDAHRNGDFTWITSGRYVTSVTYAGMLFGLHNTRLCGSFHHGRVHAGHCSDNLKPLCQAPMQ